MTADVEAHECRVPRINLEDDGVNSAQVPEGPSFRPSGFLSRDGETDGESLNATSVDVVLVPCPGARPDETWTRDPITTIFGRPPTSQHMHTIKTLSSAVPLEPALGRNAKTAPSWARGGIRKEVNMARVLSYDHGGDITNSKNLKSMADELMTHVCAERAGKLARRPLFFICHSIGGLVVKLALTMAQRDKQHRSIVEDCYGVTFFATPHRGSSHLSNDDFRARIQELLGLSHALTPRLMNELRLDHPTLLQIDDNFKQLASELQIWTFYETEDSDLSGDGACGPNDIPFKAPITSMRSAILNLRHEKVYALQSNHANCASFGMKNVQTMRMYLQDLANAIKRAESMSQGTTHVPLRLEQRVKVEVHGFYETDVTQSSQLEPNLRLFSAKEHSLQAFWEQGPDGLLESRLNDFQSDASKDPQDAQFFFQKGRATSLMPPTDLSTGQNNKAGRSSARGRAPVVATEISRSGSGDDAREGEARDSMAMESSDGECSPRSQTPVARTRANSPSPEDHSGMQNEPKGYVSRSTTGETLVPGPDTIRRPSMPHRQSSQQTSHLQLPGGTASPYTRERLGSEPTFGQDTRGLSKKTSPINATRKFVWIHVPFNNPSWVRKVFDTLSVKEERNYLELFNSEHWASRHTRGRHSQHHASYLKPACGYTPLNSKRSTILSSGQSGLGLGRGDRLSLKQQGQGCLYLYFPFLHFDTYRTLIKRRELIKRRMQQGRTRPVPSDVAKEASRELQVIWEYLGHDPPVNCRRTLDQYRYPSLHDTRARDDDQMLYKMTKERVQAGDKCQDNVSRPVSRGDCRAYTQWEEDEILDDDDKECENQCIAEADGEFEDSDADFDPDDDGILDGNVLMVDQLWLWVVDTTSLITFFPSREGNPMEGPLYQQADLRDSILNEVNADLTRQCENALDLAALAVLHAVSVLIDRSSHPNLEIFRIFEEAVSVLTEKMTSSLKRFRSLGYKDKYGADDDADLKTSSIRARHKREDERAEKENRDNTSALLELRDIEDELSTLKHLFEEQEEQINMMLRIYGNYGGPDATSSTQNLAYTNSGSDSQRTTSLPVMPPQLTTNGIAFLQEALAKLKSYRQQAEDMIKRVETTRHDFDKLLEMIQRQAQIDEVRLSRQQADLASAQNRSVMIFTIFTVLFLPLSFFTSLFGMNTFEWGGSGNLPLRTIGSIALPASVLLIVVTMVAAWSISARKAFKNMMRRVQTYQKRTKRWWGRQIGALLYDAKGRPRARIGRQRAEMVEGKRQKQKQKQRRRINREGTVQDFWGRHIEDKRDTQYEIPLRNRRGTGRESTKRGRAKVRKEKK
ncbi:hypothetical protein VSDG_07824 [Cytospora chrysosperma]|uniref:DUF676 domain-containing protein n=1 Tax=Cytospora chrysosperma TaxID=252740 RepID=A0A423VJD2_CYTCH|nr:hypothetical protein VSDG_07824 [Valsa sordida]